MYNYLRVPTRKKPLFELDPAPYHSSLHPEGQALRDLLEQGARYLEVRRAAKPETPQEPAIRSQFGIAYKWIIEHGLRKRKGALQLEADAVQELKAGRPQLLDFVKKHRSCLEDQVEYCWSLHNAPERIARLSMSRLEVLLQTAADENGTCRNGTQRCATIYNEVLTYQSVPAEKFCHLIYGALEFGRQKGNAVMLVGGKDTGKTTITEPARFIFKAMQTPQSDSFCPLEDIRGYEVILWQDLRYNPGHPRKEEQGLRIDEGTWNRLLEGLPTLIGVPKSDGSRADFVYDDDAAFIFTGPFELLAFRNGMVDQMETEQLNCRMQYIIFGRPAPPQVNRGLKHCAWCWSRWILRGELLWRRQQGVARDEFLKKVACQLGEPETHDTMARACSEPLARDEAPSASSALLASMGPTPAPRDLFGQMSAVMEWRRAGLLSDSEFLRAKALLGLS